MTGEELKTARLNRHISQAKLAKLLQVQPNTVYRYETGRLPVPHWVPKVLRLIPIPKNL